MQIPVTQSRLKLRALLIALAVTIPLAGVLPYGLTRDPGRFRPRSLDGRHQPLCSGYLMVAFSTPRLSAGGSSW